MTPIVLFITVLNTHSQFTYKERDTFNWNALLWLRSSLTPQPSFPFTTPADTQCSLINWKDGADKEQPPLMNHNPIPSISRWLPPESTQHCLYQESIQWSNPSSQEHQAYSDCPWRTHRWAPCNASGSSAAPRSTPRGGIPPRGRGIQGPSYAHGSPGVSQRCTLGPASLGWLWPRSLLDLS